MEFSTLVISTPAIRIRSRPVLLSMVFREPTASAATWTAYKKVNGGLENADMGFGADDDDLIASGCLKRLHKARLTATAESSFGDFLILFQGGGQCGGSRANAFRILFSDNNRQVDDFTAFYHDKGVFNQIG
jgi:hypothetical protein